MSLLLLRSRQGSGVGRGLGWTGAEPAHQPPKRLTQPLPWLIFTLIAIASFMVTVLISDQCSGGVWQ